MPKGRIVSWRAVAWRLSWRQSPSLIARVYQFPPADCGRAMARYCTGWVPHEAAADDDPERVVPVLAVGMLRGTGVGCWQ
jgi:hypothetical protein